MIGRALSWHFHGVGTDFWSIIMAFVFIITFADQISIVVTVRRYFLSIAGFAHFNGILKLSVIWAFVWWFLGIFTYLWCIIMAFMIIITNANLVCVIMTYRGFSHTTSNHTITFMDLCIVHALVWRFHSICAYLVFTLWAVVMVISIVLAYRLNVVWGAWAHWFRVMHSVVILVSTSHFICIKPSWLVTDVWGDA